MTLSLLLLGTSPRAFAQDSADLSSTDGAYVAGDHPQFQPVSIQVGNTTRAVAATDVLTAAEYVALQQVLATGSQSIHLSEQGQAVGGSFDVSHLSSVRPDNLVIPAGVTATYNAAQRSVLDIAGNLTNRGNLYAFSTDLQVGKATISAENIINKATGTISTVLPSSLAESLGLSGSGSLDLVLQAVRDLVNAGAITSSGSLSMTAGNLISNQGVLQAANNVNIVSSIGQLVNSGTISSLAGNLNLNTSAISNLLINNINGRLEAAAGSINLRGSSYNGIQSNFLLGGSALARELNSYSGTGRNIIYMREVDAVVHGAGGRVAVHAESGTLKAGTIAARSPSVGSIMLASLSGNLELYGDLTAAPRGVINLKAGGDIVSQLGAGKISVESNEGGRFILMVAGGLFTNTLGSLNKEGPLSASDMNSVDSWVGITERGGKIDLASVPISQLSSRALAGDANGGHMVIMAFEGASGGSGTIKLPDAVPITAGGHGAGANGTVTLLAGGSSGTTIEVGQIDSSGGSGSGLVQGLSEDPNVVGLVPTESGRILVKTAHPDMVAGQIYPPFATVVNGRVSYPNSLPLLKFRPASISAGAITSGGADTLLMAGADIGTGTLTATNSGEVRVYAGVDRDGQASRNPGNVMICGNLYADDVEIKAGAGSTFTVHNFGEQLRLAAGFTRSSSIFAPGGIFLMGERGSQIVISGNPHFMGSVTAEAPGGSVVVDSNSFVTIQDGELTIVANRLVNPQYVSAEFGVTFRGAPTESLLSSTSLPGVATIAQSPEAQFIPVSRRDNDTVPTDLSGRKRADDDSAEAVIAVEETNAGSVKPAGPRHPDKRMKRRAHEPAGARDPDLIRVMGRPGFMVYGWFSGNTRLETNNGSVIEMHNGAKITRLKDGSRITEFKDGSTLTEVGSVAVRRYPDGTVFTDYQNGTTSTKYPDGTTVLRSSDGMTIATYPDGTNMTRHPTGTVITTYADGRRVTCQADGTKITEAPDGTSTTQHPDGRKEVRRAPASGSPRQGQGAPLPTQQLPPSRGSRAAGPAGAKSQTNVPTKDRPGNLLLRLPVGHVVMSPSAHTAVQMV
ncbi:MAG TPA: T-complex 10 C-terminal domain-containing protein, partial [Candidatus Obscuribacterales bacterium]